MDRCNTWWQRERVRHSFEVSITSRRDGGPISETDGQRNT